MKRLLSVLLLSVLASVAAERPNVLFIAIDDLRNDLGSLGAAHAPGCRHTKRDKLIWPLSHKTGSMTFV